VLVGTMGFMHLSQQKWCSRTFSSASQKVSKKVQKVARPSKYIGKSSAFAFLTARRRIRTLREDKLAEKRVATKPRAS
jgi:hypothetical protein